MFNSKANYQLMWDFCPLSRFRQQAESASVAARLPLDEEDEDDRDSAVSASESGSRPVSRQNSASSMQGLRAANGRKRSPNFSREPSGK